jgi:ATP-binding cassette subfamily B protein
MKQSKGKMLLDFLQGSKRWFILALVLGLFQAVFSMVNPRIVQYTVDYIIGSTEGGLSKGVAQLVADLGGAEYLRTHLWLIAAAVVGLALLAALCRYGFIYFNAKGGEGFVRTMRNRTFSHIQKLPFSWHMTHQTGDIIQRCTTDIDLVKNFLTEQLLNLFSCIITLGAAIAFMFSVNVKLSVIIVLVQPILLGFSIYFRKKIAIQFQKCDENEGELSSIAQENLTGVRVVRAFGREAYERARFDAQGIRVRDSWIKLCQHLVVFWVITGILSRGQTLLVLTVGTVFTVHGEMTLGGLLAMISYATMAGQPVRTLGRIISEMSKAGVSIQRLYDIMSAEEEQDPPQALTPPMDGDIVFDHVNFSYPDCPVLLKDINLTIPAGTTLGILGGTGSGKSTLVHLLNRLYDLPADCGKITIGGVDVATMQRDWLRSHVGMVLQEPILFSNTLADNIALGAEGATLSDIREAARIACLDDTVMNTFAKGYDTEVGERGVTLSGGQKQRAAIARMLLQNTPIMVFDDSLSAVDAETDSKIRTALRSQMKNATCILISHRISTLMEADQIVVMGRGTVLEQGTHQELLAKNGLYKQIHDLQLECETEGNP